MLQTSFLIIFSLSLLIANIYCFAKKQYLYLFIPCMLFLPDYYGIEFNEKLPILTVARMMFLVFYLYAWVNRRRTPNVKQIDFKTLPKEYYFLGGYFVLRIISNLYYITTYGQAAKTIFEIIFEQLFLLIAVWMLAPTKQEIDKLIKVVVLVSAVMFILGIAESLTGFRIVDALYTVRRQMLNDHYIRLGLLRATVTMGLPNFYGNMCLLMLPLILYMYEIKKQKRYLFITFFDIWAMIHSGCRSDLFFLIIMMVIYVIFVLKHKERRIKFAKNASIVTGSLLLILCIFCSFSPYLKYYYVGTGKSVLNEIGFDFNLDEGAPGIVEGYGVNDGSIGLNASASRLVQLSMIPYALKTNLLFGLGSGAQVRGDTHYYNPLTKTWRSIFTYDVGYVEIISNEGLLGLLGAFFLLIFFICLGRTKSVNISPLYLFLKLYIVTYLTCMLSSANMFSFLTLFIFLTINVF